MILDFKDLYIKYDGHPRFHSNMIVEDDVIEVIVQKLEMVLFANKGSLYGEPNLGSNLEYFLWETKVPVSDIRSLVVDQINTYVPELNQIGYNFNAELFEGSYRDILYLNFVIKGYNFEMLLK
jgi:hypothetical protein